MTTMETTKHTGHEPEQTKPSQRHPLAIALVAIVALLLAGLGGWMLRGSDDESDAVVVAGAQLTDRQEEMLRVAEEYELARANGDVDAVLELFVPQGVINLNGDIYRADDGSMAGFVAGLSAPSRVDLDPVLVHEDLVVSVLSYGGNNAQMLKFTPSGEVLIIRSVIVW